MILLEAYPPPPIEPGQFFTMIGFFLGLFVLWLLRKLPVFSTVWRIVVVFFVVLFGILFWNKFKGDFKEFFK